MAPCIKRGLTIQGRWLYGQSKTRGQNKACNETYHQETAMLTEIDIYVARLLLIKNLTEKRDTFHHRSTLYAIVNDEINQLMEMCTEDMQTMYIDKQ